MLRERHVRPREVREEHRDVLPDDREDPLEGVVLSLGVHRADEHVARRGQYVRRSHLVVVLEILRAALLDHRNIGEYPRLCVASASSSASDWKTLQQQRHASPMKQCPVRSMSSSSRATHSPSRLTIHVLSRSAPVMCKPMPSSVNIAV
jgi:hypothetical protein